MPLAETSKNKPRKAVTTRKPFIDMDEEEEEGGGGGAAGSTIVDETMDDDANDQDESNSEEQRQQKNDGESDIEDDADADEDDDDVGQIGEAAEPDNDNDDDDDEGAEEDPDSNQSSEQEEQVEPPAFSLATLGLQRVGSAPPPKPKGQKAPIPTLNARGMPARIRKKNPLFYDENIINDDKPLRMSLAPKKVGPGRPPNSAGGNAAAKAVVGAIPSKVLKKRKGVVSRYMRTSDNGSSSNSASSQQGSGAGAVGKLKKSPIKLQAKSAGGGAGGAAGRAQSSMHGKTGKGGIRSIEGGGKGQSALAAAMATAQEDASKAEAAAATNKRLGQSIGLRLRNLLKLPKAHKWAIAEWFYSYIDKPLFDSKDEFMNHVSELAPRLGTRKLNRHEWVNIRRRMGRPRRCSANFFSEERKELDRKRQMMRTLQSRKPGELKEPGLLSDMPEKIPMPLPLGTKVTARLRSPQDGIFGGTVAAYDSLNAMYRVTFERQGLGTHSIPDYEIVSENFHEMLPLQSFTKDFRPNLVSIYHPSCLGFTTNLGFTANLSYSQKRLTPSANGGIGGGNPGLQSSPQKHLATNNAAARNALSMKLNKSDPLLGQDAVGESPGRQQLTRHHGYPMKLLEHLLHLENYITCKNSKIQRLNKMNTTAELTMGEMVGQEEAVDRQRKGLRDDFQRRYASNIISIERINSELMYELTKVQELSSSLTRNPNVQAMISPTYLREECRTKAGDTVDDLNKGLVKSARMIKLLKNLTTLLIVTQNLGGECESNEVNKVLEGCIEEVRSNLVCSDNIVVFQKSVQLRLEYIAMDITRCLEEQGLNRTSEHGTKTPKSEALEESLDQVVADDDQQKRKNDQQNESSGHKDDHEHDRADHMDVDNVEHEMESEEEKKHETREPREPPQPATIEDTQITIESIKESEEDDDTEEDHQSPQQKQKPNVKEYHSQMEVLEDVDDDEDGEEEFILEDEN